MNKKKIISSVIFISFLCVGTFAYAQITPPPGVPETIPALLVKITEAVGGIIAAIGVIMIIVAGIFYLTSAGNPERIGVAKKALIYAIVGIVLGLAAGAIAGAIEGVIK